MSERVRIQRRKKISDSYSYPQLATDTRALRMGTAQASVNHDISRISMRPQGRLTVSQPGDFYEQEADRVAQQVMGMGDRANNNDVQREASPQEEEENLQLKSLGNTITPLVQREEIPEEEEEEENLQMKSLGNLAIQREEIPEEEEEENLQMKSLGNLAVQREEIPEEEEEEENLQMKSSDNLAIQREEIPEEEEEEELIQAKSSLQRFHDGGLAASSDISSKLHSRKGQGNPLAGDVRNFMEPRFGVDFSNVKVHTDGEAVQMSRELGAQAFTYGSDVYFGAGKSPGNNELTAHELTHIVQQVGGVQRKCAACEEEEKQVSRKEDGNTQIINTISTSVTAPKISHKPQPELLQLKHLNIKESITEYTKKENAPNTPSVVAEGQFYWSNRLSELIKAEVFTFLLSVDPTDTQAQNLGDKILKLLDAIWGYDTSMYKLMLEIQQILSKNTIKNTQQLRSLFLYPNLTGENMYFSFWAFYRKNEKLPDLKRYTSIPAFLSLHQYEAQACGTTAGIFINRFLSKKGFKDVDSSKKRNPKNKFAAGIASSATRNMCWINNSSLRGDVANFNGLSSAITKMQVALDDGFVIHARVLSGLCSGGGCEKDKCRTKANKVTPAPYTVGVKDEHSIVIIGYDGNEFVFWDPDSGASNGYGTGFGSLFYNSNRLTTAADDSLIPVDANGNHSGQHRYQVLSMYAQ